MYLNPQGVGEECIQYGCMKVYKILCFDIGPLDAVLDG